MGEKAQAQQPTIQHTRASLGHSLAARNTAPPPEPFKISRFKNVSPRVVIPRGPSSQPPSSPTNSDLPTNRPGSGGHGTLSSVGHEIVNERNQSPRA
eukprot:TRINITY_DN420_c0_g1_i5.p1 TRINITY_DN420_c0_g1~~TRINITY_DN420_c0_g1_i5.p1  ORF type:complete len:107 (+),score=41.48 TRINITY_DN420_c0_g1_i5:33-323(+)